MSLDLTELREAMRLAHSQIRLPMNRAQRRRQAAIAVKAMRDDLILAGIDHKKERKRLAKWDGASRVEGAK